jgi:LuxR family transcriptional regulator, maltose regulon positive regulatory protein
VGVDWTVPLQRAGQSWGGHSASRSSGFERGRVPMSDLVSIRDRARFSGPTKRTDVVARLRLDERYAAANGQVLRVLAPAGYGKSTQVLRWVGGDERRVRWLDLEPIDNDPLVLAYAIAGALSDGLPRDPGAPGDRVAQVADLVELVAAPNEAFVLVLDDVHHIESEESSAVIDLVVDHLSPDSVLLLVGRSPHRSDSIARHRLDPGVIDVTADDLALDLAETEEMLEGLGLEVDTHMLAAIDEQFEGWPAGLRLAGQVLATHRGDLRIPLDKLGDLAHVTDYVTQEWFGALGPEDQELLTEVGCLERFSGAMCDAVLDRTDTAATLRRLCRGELMLIGLDEHDEWYRMHAVLSRWLSSRLRSVEPGRWSDIHVRAARWWSSQGDADLAIEHAVEANDTDLVESLVVQHCGPHAARGMYRTIDRWLEHFDDTRVRDSLPLMQMKALLHIGIGGGEQALRWTRLCRREADAAHRTPAGVASILAHQTDVLYATLEDLPACDLIPVVEDAYQNLDHGEWRALACLALGANSYLCGRDGAVDLLREALFENEVARTTTLQATAAGSLAIVLDLEGCADEAAALSDRAIRLLATPLGNDASSTAVSLGIASLIDARAGRFDGAAARRDAGRRKLAGFKRSAPWFGILGLIPLIKSSLLLDEAKTALDMLHELEAKMESQARTTSLARHIDELGETVRSANSVLVDRWALTSAELRVAQYLPTNLSLGEIATQLFVSRNTVKSQAAAIYRKLGATSRSDAVDLARAAGLISETAKIT